MTIPKILLLTLIAGLLAGCTAAEPTATSAPTAVPTATSEPTETVTETIAKSKRYWQATKIKKIDAVTVESSMQVENDDFGELLNNNGDCRLPCLLGFDVNDQSFEEINQYFTTIAIREPVFSDNDQKIYNRLDIERHSGNGRFSSVYIIGDLSILSSFEYWKKADTIEQIVLSAIHFFDHKSENEIVTKPGFGEEAFVNYYRYYNPQSIITNYGSPEQIFVFAQPLTEIEQGPYNPFSLLFIYETQRFAIEYDYWGQENGNTYIACIPQFTGFSVTVFDEHLSSQEIGSRMTSGFGIYWEKFRLFEEVTQMGIQELVDLVINSYSIACLETAKIFWNDK
jgi:hypothetical protein